MGRWLIAGLLAPFSLLVPQLVAESSFPSADPGEIRIASFNVSNYITMPRRIGGRLRAQAGKPLAEREAVARSIAAINADAVCLEEVGTPAEFQDLCARVRKAGCDYPVTEYLSGEDPTRHLALLSRFPIVERHSVGDVPLRVGGLTLHSPRGVLDVTLEPRPGYRVRLLGVHLKAKLEVPDYDATALREAEAGWLRGHVREILARDPESRLVVAGDFNDTWNSRTIRGITGEPGKPDSLKALPLTDDRGECWTEFWEGAGVYSRIDYVMVSKKLEPELDSARSGVARFPFWREASDHCPVVITLNTPADKTPTGNPTPCATTSPSPR